MPALLPGEARREVCVCVCWGGGGGGCVGGETVGRRPPSSSMSRVGKDYLAFLGGQCLAACQATQKMVPEVCLTCLHTEKSIAMLGALALRFRSWRDIEAYSFRSVSCLASCLVFGLEPVWARYLTKPNHRHICARSFSINSHGFESSRKASFSSLPLFLLANKAESVPQGVVAKRLGW